MEDEEEEERGVKEKKSPTQVRKEGEDRRGAGRSQAHPSKNK